MKDFIGAHQVVSAAEYLELALGGLDDPPHAGIDRDLFRGPRAAESAADRAARLDAATDILDDLREQGRADEVAALDAAYAARLRVRARQRRTWRGVAA